MTKRTRGTRSAMRSRSACAPFAAMYSAGSAPPGITTQYMPAVVVVTNCMARSAAFRPASSPSNRHTIRPRDSLSPAGVR